MSQVRRFAELKQCTKDGSLVITVDRWFQPVSAFIYPQSVQVQPVFRAEQLSFQPLQKLTRDFLLSSTGEEQCRWRVSGRVFEVPLPGPVQATVQYIILALMKLLAQHSHCQLRMLVLLTGRLMGEPNQAFAGLGQPCHIGEKIVGQDTEVPQVDATQ